MSRVSLLLVLCFLFIVGLLFLGPSVLAGPDDTTITCSVPNNVVCDIADPDGIQAVQVELHTAQGQVLVVDETYTCQTAVTVSWDPIVPNAEFNITPCGTPGDDIGAADFSGLVHWPLGSSGVYLAPDSLVVRGFDASGDSGVLVELAEASHWDGLLQAQAGRNVVLDLEAYPAGGTTPVSTLNLVAGPGALALTPAFDSATGHFDLWDGSQVAYSSGDLPTGVNHLKILEPFCEGHADLLLCEPRLGFGIMPHTFESVWTLDLPETFSFTHPAGTVQADRVVFYENPDAPLEEPVSIEQIRLKGTDVSLITLFEENIRRSLAKSTLYLPVVLRGTPDDDPFDLAPLTAFMMDDSPPSDPLQVNPYLNVRHVGSGVLIDEDVVEPDPGHDPGGGTIDPRELPVGTVPFGRQALRVFNTATLQEFEIAIDEELLAEIHGMRDLLGLTSASFGLSNPAGSERLDSLTLATGLDRAVSGPQGWSNGIDSRVKLFSTTAWPWRTIVHFSNNCSGVLIGPRHILTAAHCINQRGTNNWYTFTASPGRNGDDKPYGDAVMSPNPQPGDPFRWYYTPAPWRSAAYNSTNCPDPCYAATEWDWGLIIIPEYLGYQTGWMGYVARPGSQLNQVYHYNRGYPACSSKPNVPGDCEPGTPRLYGDTNWCTMGNYLFPGPDNWNRVIRNSCDISGGHSGSPVYHYFYDTNLGQWVPVAAMVEVWEHCTTCDADDDTPNSARRITPGDLNVISFFRQWAP